jgi:serine protease Do
MRHKLMLSGLVAAGFSAAVLVGCARAEFPVVHPAREAEAVFSSSTTTHQLAASTVPDFSWLAQKYGPAVVNVIVTEVTKSAAVMRKIPGVNPQDPFWQFFRQFQLPQQSREIPVSGLGSGFIISPDGVILTNAHVVSGAKDVKVTLTDRREYRAKVMGMDTHSDVAVLKIDASNLPTVKLGNSAEVKIGQWVVAIGSPFGFDNTVTSGIVSAKARSLGSDTYVPYLQTDVVVNPGSSGGPLFDLRGNVIGINSQIYSRSGGYQGLSFAIPIEVALQVKDDLLHYGHVTHGRLGVTIQGVNRGLADAFGLKQSEGAVVSSVDPSGPAAKAGVESGDVILQLNGTNINDSNSLPSMVATLKPGTKATLHIWRHGSARDIAVTIGALSDDVAAATPEPGNDQGRLGVVVRPLTPAERQQAGIGGGLLVNSVSGAAAAAGIESGDIIVGLNGTPVKSDAQLRQLVANASKHVALLVHRENATLFVPVDLG